MREKERLKMGGKEEKRGACRGESLIICLPKNHTTTVWRTHTEGPGRRKERCGNGEDEWVMRWCELRLKRDI